MCNIVKKLIKKEKNIYNCDFQSCKSLTNDSHGIGQINQFGGIPCESTLLCGSENVGHTAYKKVFKCCYFLEYI